MKYNQKAVLMSFIASIMLSSKCNFGDRDQTPPLFTTIVYYHLSDTSDEIKSGTKLQITALIPNPIISTSGDTIHYNSITHSSVIGFYSFILGDSVYCSLPAVCFETNKGLDYSSRFMENFDFKTRVFGTTFMAKDTGWHVFDCLQNIDQITVKNGNKETEIKLIFKFSAPSNLQELNKLYPCNKAESDQKVMKGIGYYGFKVID